MRCMTTDATLAEWSSRWERDGRLALDIQRPLVEP